MMRYDALMHDRFTNIGLSSQKPLCNIRKDTASKSASAVVEGFLCARALHDV